MKQKILSFVVHKEKFLALKGNPHPEHGEGGWFVVTGGVEDNETHEEAVAREVLEETNLTTKEIISLNWGSIYNWHDDVCEELNFVSFVDFGEIKLNEEHSEYEWLNIGDFIGRIKWDDNKELLREVLEMALNRKQYFKKREMRDCRENNKKNGE